MIEPGRIQTIFFDAAGTLIRVRGSVGEIYSETMARYGVRLSSAVIEERFAHVFRVAPPMIFPGADPQDVPDLERGWWRDLVAEVMHPADPFERFEECFEELYELFRTERGWELAPGARGVLDYLAAEGVVIGIISNFDSRLHNVLRTLGVAPYFRSVTLASEVGIAKPHPDLFRTAMRRHGLGKREALYVGDNPAQDVEGALEAGLIPVLIHRAERADATAGLGFFSLDEFLAWYTSDLNVVHQGSHP